MYAQCLPKTGKQSTLHSFSSQYLVFVVTNINLLVSEDLKFFTTCIHFSNNSYTNEKKTNNNHNNNEINGNMFSCACTMYMYIQYTLYKSALLQYTCLFVQTHPT